MPAGKRPWSLLSSHGLCFVYISWHPQARLSDIAAAAGITERRASQIVRDLVEAGLVTVSRRGRRKRYSVNGAAVARHPMFAHLSADDSILALLNGLAPDGPTDTSSAPC
jgi:DNA-binding MarR family transcriptional regulator